MSGSQSSLASLPVVPLKTLVLVAGLSLLSEGNEVVETGGEVGLGQLRELHQLVLVQEWAGMGVESPHGEEEERPDRHDQMVREPAEGGG